MTATPKFSNGNAITRKVTNGLTARAKRLVEATNTGTVQEATNRSLRVVGVAQNTQTSPDPDQALSSNPSVLGEVTIRRGEVLPVIYSAPANFGDDLVCTGAGEVGPAAAPASAGASPTAAEFTSAINEVKAIVGKCEATIAAPGEGLASISNPT